MIGTWNYNCLLRINIINNYVHTNDYDQIEMNTWNNIIIDIR